MANKKRNKYPQSKLRADARRYVIKAGEYNGGSSSTDFMVSGHSTGSPYSEMEELSEQVTREAGGEPYRPVQYADDQGETGYDEYQGEGLGDLGGPELYGDKPSLLKKSPIRRAGTTSRGLAIGAAVGLAATALLGGLAYLLRENRREEERSHVRHARGNVSRTSAVTAKPAARKGRAKKSGRAASRTPASKSSRSHVRAH